MQLQAQFLFETNLVKLLPGSLNQLENGFYNDGRLAFPNLSDDCPQKDVCRI